MRHYSLSDESGRCYNRDQLGVSSTVQGVNPGEYFGAYIEYGKQSNSSMYFDYEPSYAVVNSPGLSRLRSKSQLNILARYADECRSPCRAIREAMPWASIGLYSDPPILHNPGYAEPQDKYVADNARINASGAYDDADWMGVKGYIHKDFTKGMTPEWARGYTRTVIKASEVYSRRRIVFLMPTFEGSSTELPAGVLEAQCEVIDAAGLDSLLWYGGCDLDTAKRWVERMEAGANGH